MSRLQQDRIRVEVTRQPIDVPSLHQEVEDAGAGAVLSFVGCVRNNKLGREVLRIDYEAYEPMALRQLGRIAREIVARWPMRRLVMVHRVGRLEVGEESVAIVLSTPHRAEGFEALRHAIETLKKDVPIWKREHFEDGEVWVQEGA